MHARNYRAVKGQPYTRKKYMRGFPPSKIVKFTMGNSKVDFDYEVKLVSLKRVQIRHNALEAARIATNRLLLNNLPENYFLKILPYPHCVLRENKMIFGAHADRLQDGMRASFGKPIGTAARVEPNQKIIIVKVNKQGIDAAKESLSRGKSKLPVPCKIVVDRINTPNTPEKVELD